MEKEFNFDRNEELLEIIKDDLRTDEVWDEGEDGIWILLRRGFCGDYGHAVHEWSMRSLLRSFAAVKPCSCGDCMDNDGTASGG